MFHIINIHMIMFHIIISPFDFLFPVEKKSNEIINYAEVTSDESQQHYFILDNVPGGNNPVAKQ